MKQSIKTVIASGAMSLLLAAATFSGGLVLSTETAEAGLARLAAIKRVEGLHERKNRKQIQAMVGVNPASTPWCGAAVAYAVRKAGGQPVAGHNKAVSWTRFGKAVSPKAARSGDIVVIRTKRGHHVTIFSRDLGNGRFEGCGGNQKNSFRCSSYRLASIKAVRR